MFTKRMFCGTLLLIKKLHLIGTYTSLISSFASKWKNANCFCINSLKLRMAHMVEKGQPIWQKRDMSEAQGWGQIRICICKYKYKYKYGIFVFVFVFDQISNHVFVFVFVFDPLYLVYLTNTFSNTLFPGPFSINTNLWKTNLHEYSL